MCSTTTIYVLYTIICDIRVLVAPAVYVSYYYYMSVLIRVYTRVYVRSTAMGLAGLTKDYLRIVLGGQVYTAYMHACACVCMHALAYVRICIHPLNEPRTTLA